MFRHCNCCAIHGIMCNTWTCYNEASESDIAFKCPNQSFRNAGLTASWHHSIMAASILNLRLNFTLRSKGILYEGFGFLLNVTMHLRNEVLLAASIYHVALVSFTQGLWKTWHFIYVNLATRMANIDNDIVIYIEMQCFTRGFESIRA